MKDSNSNTSFEKMIDFLLLSILIAPCFSNSEQLWSDDAKPSEGLNATVSGCYLDKKEDCKSIFKFEKEYVETYNRRSFDNLTIVFYHPNANLTIESKEFGKIQRIPASSGFFTQTLDTLYPEHKLEITFRSIRLYNSNLVIVKGNFVLQMFGGTDNYNRAVYGKFAQDLTRDGRIKQHYMKFDRESVKF